MFPKIVKSITDLFANVPFRISVAALGTCVILAAMPVPGRAVPASGRITGIVQLAAPGRTPLRSGAYPSRQLNRATPQASEIANVVVFVKDPPVEAAPPVTRTPIAQRDEAFVPRVAAITRASTVEFPNYDPYFHNVFSLSRDATFDLGRFRKGEKRERTFDHAGLVKVFCHIHSEMSATIMVFDHRFYAVPAADGRFTIDRVPPGTYQVSAWHERIGETTKPIQIVAGDDAHVEFSLPVVTR
jgi:plastocyanin